MRRLPLAMIAALGAISTAAEAAPALMAPINQSVPINLPRGTRDVLIGNPAIADVSVLDSGKAVLVGKGYGVTNLVIIDQLGRTVLNRQVVVAAPTGNVSVIRGAKVEDYACASRCEPAGKAVEAEAEAR
jgi:Flp pilus assembly protein, secretin CpaC